MSTDNSVRIRLDTIRRKHSIIHYTWFFCLLSFFLDMLRCSSFLDTLAGMSYLRTCNTFKVTYYHVQGLAFTPVFILALRVGAGSITKNVFNFVALFCEHL